MSDDCQILFITSNRIGDAILSTGLLNYIVETEPGARITVACGPLARDLFINTPGVVDVHVMRKKKYGWHWAGLLGKILGKRWKRIIDLRGSATAYLCWARHRHVLRANHVLPRVAHIGAVMDLSPPPAPRLWIDDEAHSEVARLLPDDMYISLGPTANWPQKTWSPHYFAELAWRLANEQGPLANARIILHGGPGEEKDLEPIIKTLPPGLVINLAGCRLPVAAAAMERSVVYIGNDSGLTHLSAATGVPTLALFGPTREDLYAPWGDHAMAVRGSLDYDALLASPGFDIERLESQMGDLDVDMVYNAVIDLLNSQNKGS